MAAHEWEDWFEREELIGQISDIRVQNLQVERELVQKRTFTRWMNLHLEKCDPPIEIQDLFRDIQDGRILMALLEELSGCKLLHGFKRSSHRIFRLNNIAKVLSFLEERNVKLVSIDAADVADGNSSIILGLIWNIILFFQIKELTGNIRSQFPSSSSLSSIPTSSDSDMSLCSTPSDDRQLASSATREHSKAIKKLLQWVQKRTRKYGVAVQDFGKSWTSGLAFLAVIKSIDPSLVDMRKALLRSARENLEDAFRIAHYSLGIPRLLEPEDVTINAPDEQSIMMYVSQFLEHFPGTEEPEQPCQLIERSMSMGRLNFRDPDYDHMRNSAYRSRVKERSYMFQKDCGRPPPKILVSSVSEDRGAMKPSFRVAAARSWSSDDFLVDSPHMKDNPSSETEDAKESTNPNTDSPQLTDFHSPTGSSVLDSVNTSIMGDSAISSPDSWEESEYGMIPEKCCESRSDSSLFDSGTAWDVYRATPIEVTPCDEGFVPMADGVPDEQSATESYIDEGIFSLSSLDSNQVKIQGHDETKQYKNQEVTESSREQVPGDNDDELTTEAKTQQKDTSFQEKDNALREKESPPGLCDAEDLLSTGVKGHRESDRMSQSQHSPKTERPCHDVEEAMEQNRVGVSDAQQAADIMRDSRESEEIFHGQTHGRSGGLPEVEDEPQCQETNSPFEERSEESGDKCEILEVREEGVLESQASSSRDTCDLLLKTHPTTQDGNSNQCLDRNIPLMSISMEPQEQGEEGTCGPGKRDQITEGEGTDTDTSRHESLHEQTYDTHQDDTTRPSEIPEICSDHQGGDGDSAGPGTVEETGRDEVKQEFLRLSTNPDVIVQSSTDAQTHLVNSERYIGSTNQPDGLQGIIEVETSQENTFDPVSMQATAGSDSAARSRPTGIFHTEFEENTATDILEPMDLFYPDKEEAVFTEPPDHEMQSWPSVLSVSALQPAPASTQASYLLDEEARSGLDSIEEQDEMTFDPKQVAQDASDLQQPFFMSGEKSGALAGRSDVSEAELQSPGSEPRRCDTESPGGPDESQTPPVLRQRKGLRPSQSTHHQTEVSREPDDGDSDLWCSESQELYLLLLLWLLLYCFWLLPQMDLKTLPGLLLNH
ncbi:uncharacterized protein clmna [Aulostomus maculatus]